MEKRNKVCKKLTWQIVSESALEIEKQGSYMTQKNRRNYINILKPIYEKFTKQLWPLINDEDWTNENIEKVSDPKLYLKDLADTHISENSPMWMENERISGIYWPMDDTFYGQISPLYYIDAYLWAKDNLRGKEKDLWIEFIRMLPDYIEKKFNTHSLKEIGLKIKSSKITRDTVTEYIEEERLNESPFYDFDPQQNLDYTLSLYIKAEKSFCPWNSERVVEIKNSLKNEELSDIIEKFLIYDSRYKKAEINRCFHNTDGIIIQAPWILGCFDDVFHRSDMLLTYIDEENGLYCTHSDYIGIDSNLSINKLVPFEPLQDFESLITLINNDYSYAYKQKQECVLGRLKRFARIR